MSKQMSNNNYTQKLFVEAGTGIALEKDGQRRCLGCMELYSKEYEVCPYCGYTTQEEVENALHIFPGTVLHEKYVIGRVIGYGGFGVTYLAWDTVLQIKVAIKEYLPSEFSTRAAGQTQITVFSGDKTKQFNDGMDKFIDEAKRLAKFRSENGIVKIFDSFNENGTAYIAMEYLQGETLAERLEREKTIPVEESIEMLMPIIESLNRVHDEGIIHRDIAPDNIFLTNKGEVKLIDFGASRYATTSRSRSLTVIIKPGFSAEEQYRSRGDQGPHTDVYSVGAVLYKMITGEAPPDAMERRALFEKNGRDMLKPIRKFKKDIDPRRENAIYNALNIRIEDRTPDMISLAGELLSEEPVKKRRSGIKKIDPLTWPLWAKISIPSALVSVITLCFLLAFGVIGPKSSLETQYYIPDGQTLVPDIVAMNIENADKKLANYELKYQIAGAQISPAIEMDKIMLQDPDAFNVANKGSIVNIIISEGHGKAYVPDVVGLTLELAEETLKEEGDYIIITEMQSSDIIAKGAVIEQEFEPGTMLERGSEIKLIISSGSENIDTSKTVKVPDIVGKDYSKVQKELAKVGLMLAIGENVYNPAIPNNQIVGQSPVAGSTAYQGDTIVVTVNKGAKTVFVPDVVNKTYEDAAYTLQNAGLEVYTKYAVNNKYAPGTVFAQSLEAGKEVKVGTEITLTISKADIRSVPNVIGMKLNDAEEEIKNAGLSVGSLSYEVSDSVAKDRIISQGSAPDSKLEYGAPVDLVVSSGKNEVATDSNQNSNSLISLTIDKKPSKTQYYIGEKLDTQGLVVIARYANGSTADVTNSCTFSGDNFTAQGSATIKVTYSDNGVNKYASFMVNVIKPSVVIRLDGNTVIKGKTLSLSATTDPSGGSVKWSSSDTSILSVSGNTAKGVEAGNASVIATFTYAGNEYTDSVGINVVKDKIDIKSITLESSATINQTYSKKLVATYQPTNATETALTWSSSNTKVATVSADGEVTGVNPGTATITVKAPSGVKAECKVTVREVPIKSIRVAKVPDITKYHLGDTLDTTGMLVEVIYEDGKSKTISSGFTVSPQGTFKTKGEQTITITVGDKKATFTVTVEDAKVTINKPDKSALKVGESLQLSATTIPSGQSVSWSSSNTKVATVNNNGYVSAVGAGSAEIKAQMKYGSSTFTSVFNITVEDDIKITAMRIKSEPKEKNYYVGDTLNTTGLELELVYSNGKTEKIEGSYDYSPKTLDNAGTQTITVTYNNFKQTFTVNVAAPKVEISKSSVTVEVRGKTANLTASVKPEGGTISWVVTNSSMATVTGSGNTATVTGRSAGTTSVKAVYSYKGKNYESAACTVTVNGAQVERIELLGSPSRTYYVGDYVDLSGITVRAYYGDGTYETVNSGYTISPKQLTSTSQNTVTVSLGGQSDDFTISSIRTPKITISVKNIEMFYSTSAIYDAPTYTFEPADSSKWSDLKWESGDTSRLTISGTGQLKPQSDSGTTTITLSAKYNGIEITSNSVEVKVEPLVPTSFRITKAPKRTVYYVGDTLETEGLTLSVTYSDGSVDNEVTSGFRTAIPNMSTTGTKNIIVSYQNLSDKNVFFTIEVDNPTIKLSWSSVNEKVKVDFTGDIVSPWGTPEWHSTNSNIKVDSNGNVSGEGTGEIWMTCTYHGKPFESNRLSVTLEPPTTQAPTTQPPTTLPEDVLSDGSDKDNVLEF